MPDSSKSLPPPYRSLSARLLVLTMSFVMMAEVLIFVPSIARFRSTYFEDRIAAAHLAALALEATPDNMLSRDLQDELLRHVGAHSVVMQRRESKALILSDDQPLEIDDMVSLRREMFFDRSAAVVETLMQSANRVLRVRGPSPQDPNVTIELVMDETPLREAMWDFTERIMFVSAIVSLLTAVLVYISLRWMMVRPMRRLTESMMAFRENPDDPSRVIVPSKRTDEIGLAEAELATLQQRLRAALGQRSRLAALGEAVAKINHDLRNILSTAQLMSDRLGMSNDPQVKRTAPMLMKAIDRAINLCVRTMDFAKPRPEIVPSSFPLRDLVTDVTTWVSPTLADKAEIVNSVPAGFRIYADRDQLARVLSNLLRNAGTAGATRIAIGARADNDDETQRVVIDVADNGPGLPENVKQRLFQPFAGSPRDGSTGLGLAIVRDLARAHGGDIALISTGDAGTAFRLTLPQPDARRARALRRASGAPHPAE
ncbi:MAG TPA: HAMP domain-containing sensor histidine kinase [Alphaproteobacteria bacterium]|jgi:signal transduction histidine kinase